ncbi:MAG: TolC family protein [Gammaproteobacteria bacterium]|nr:TolC family protein [Gammaproteobacteria bacterium]
MPLPADTPSRTFLATLLTVVIGLCFQSSVAQTVDRKPGVGVAILYDGESERMADRQQKYIDELLTLVSSEFDVRIEVFRGNWTRESIEQAMADAYAAPEIDMLLVTGFVANQIAAAKGSYPKPTFLPTIVDTGLLPVAAVVGSSGIPNLNYLAAYADFSNDLDILTRIVPYKKLVLFVDKELASAIPELRERAYAASAAKGVELIVIMHDGIDHALMKRIPTDTDAIFVSGLPRMPNEKFDLLIDSINDAELPSYSFIGGTDVERGLLATNNEPRDLNRQARLNALNMQAVMLGERAEDQPVASPNKPRLTINMATARRIGLSPSFDIMSEATLLNQERTVSGQAYGLVEIAREAIAKNRDLQVERFGLLAGTEEIARARARLLPQLDAGLGTTTRRVTPSVSAGFLAERTADGSLKLNQLIYSDSAMAALAIQKSLQRDREKILHEFRLDVIQAATTAYYQALNTRAQLAVEESNLNVTRTNRELARDRVRVGSSTPADIYRWDAEVARAQIRLLNAQAEVAKTWTSLTRILHRSQNDRFALRDATFNEPFVITRREFDTLISSPADYERFSAFMINRGLEQAPELAQIDARLAAKRRELVSEKRSYWLPEFSIGGQYTSNLNQSGAGPGTFSGEGLNDWSVGVQATLPLFTGGLRKANVSRASFELRQLEAFRSSTAERVEEEIRDRLSDAQAGYGRIDLSVAAAEATRKNFELVSDAYARGTVSIIDLLDAQDASLDASGALIDSHHQFLITIMALQRSVGGFDYLLPAGERQALANELRAHLRGRQE